jgi:hypothetical protein
VRSRGSPETKRCVREPRRTAADAAADPGTEALDQPTWVADLVPPGRTDHEAWRPRQLSPPCQERRRRSRGSSPPLAIPFHVPGSSSTAPSHPVAPHHGGAAKTAKQPSRAVARNHLGESLAAAIIEGVHGFAAAHLRRRRDDGGRGGAGAAYIREKRRATR